MADRTPPPDAWTRTEAGRGAESFARTRGIEAATRQEIFHALKSGSIQVRTRSDWGAQRPALAPQADWDYHSIALHHAGNSFSCGIDGQRQMRSIQDIDMRSFGQISYHYAIDCAGVVYETLDIREKGSHIEGGNTGVIGIVLLADLSVRGEAAQFGPGVQTTMAKKGISAGIKEWVGVQKDRLDVSHDDSSEKQIVAAERLVEVLKKFFKISRLGGHREFATARGSSRACPGVFGLVLAERLRSKFKLDGPV